MANNTIRMSGLVSGMDTESIVGALMSAQRYKATKLQNKITTTGWKKDVWKDLNKKLYAFYTGSLYKLKMQTNYNTKKVTSSDEANATVTCNSNAAEGSNTLTISKLAKAQNVTGDVLSTSITEDTKLTTLGFANGDTISVQKKGAASPTVLTVDENTSVASFLSKMKSAGLSASYDSTQKRFYLSSSSSGTTNAFSIDSSNATAFAKMGLEKIDASSGTPTYDTANSTKMTVVAASDASFNYNNVDMTSSSNTVEVNGLTINLKSTTDAGEVVNLNVGKDTDSVYNMVKTFVTDYNTLLKELYTDYDADTAKGYEPLTDDQKSNMSDDAVEKWETKIKSSLLRRDDNLGSVINAMRTSMSGMVKIDGKSYSLATFGIGSTSYTENGQLHIDGNADDSSVSGKKDKLKAAISSDPDKVADVLAGLATDLYQSFSKSMKSSTLRSALTMYNDKEMTQQVKDYQEELDNLNDKLDDMETRYYKQFSAMESTMAKMNSQSSSLSSLLSSK